MMRAMRTLSFLVLPFALLGCKAPPQAPTRLEELCNFVFTHFDDAETEELTLGLDNLETWLNKGNNLADTLEGYQITNLDKAAVENIDTSSEDVDALLGAAVANRHHHSTKRVSRAVVVDDWEEVAKLNYNVYDRDFHKEPSCFPGRECMRIGATSYAEAKFAGIIDVVTRNRIQFRWIESDAGWMMLQRSWLTEPADVSMDNIEVNAQYFLTVTYPETSNKSVRLQATWIDADYGALPVSEDFAKQQIVKSMQKQGEAVEEWLDGD
jgi:hypothetical protein